MCKFKIVLFFQTALVSLPSPHSHALVRLTSLRPTVGIYYQNAKRSLSLLADVALASSCYVPEADVATSSLTDSTERWPSCIFRTKMPAEPVNDPIYDNGLIPVIITVFCTFDKYVVRFVSGFQKGFVKRCALLR